MKRSLIPILIFAAISSAADIVALEESIRQEMSAQGVPGAAVAIVEDGRIVLAKGLGVASFESKIPVTAQTLFRLGSTSKIFTAATALRLADQGMLDLDAPISRHGVPERFGALTLRQLLTHTSGLTDDAPQTGPHDETALDHNVRSWGQEAILTTPGKLFSYSNIGYVLAGFVIEKAMKRPFATVVAKRFCVRSA